MGVPVIDLEPFLRGSDSDRRRVGRSIDDACAGVGFFGISGHGVDPIVERDAWDATVAFFAAPIAVRMAAVEPHPAYPYGYRPFVAETLARSLGGAAPADLKETFNVGPVDAPPRPREEMDDPDERATFAPNVWPDPIALPEFRPAIERYYRAMADLARELMRAFAVALDLPAEFFDPFIDRHGSALRLAHYPPLTHAPLPGQLRAGAHTDYGTLTVLRTDSEPGLEVQTASGAWTEVPAVPDGYVVNLGDLMARWTNDRWRSTLHRVVVVDAGVGRLSIPFFHNANWDARVECLPTCLHAGERPRYEPVLAGPHLMAKFRSTVM